LDVKSSRNSPCNSCSPHSSSPSRRRGKARSDFPFPCPAPAGVTRDPWADCRFRRKPTTRGQFLAKQLHSAIPPSPRRSPQMNHILPLHTRSLARTGKVCGGQLFFAEKKSNCLYYNNLCEDSEFICVGKVWFICMLRLGEGGSAFSDVSSLPFAAALCQSTLQ